MVEGKEQKSVISDDASHWTLEDRLTLAETLTSINSHLASIRKAIEELKETADSADSTAQTALNRVILHERIVIGLGFVIGLVAGVYNLAKFM